MTRVEELRIVKKLLSLGHRPGKIFTLSLAERRELPMKSAEQERPPNLARQTLTKELAPSQIGGELRAQLHKLGLANFIEEGTLAMIMRARLAHNNPQEKPYAACPSHNQLKLARGFSFSGHRSNHQTTTETMESEDEKN